jgi:hypothetical protein
MVIMKTISMSAYWSDKLEAVLKELSTEPYSIECHRGSDDMKSLIKAVNQGIDSHLEAVFFKQSDGTHGRIKFTFEAKSLPILVRRLMEADDDESQMLGSDIFGTLGIELI